MEYQNWSRFLPAAAVALLLAMGPLMAAEEGDETAAPAAVESAGTAAGREAIDIVGRDVLDQENERIGRVTNVLIGPAGRVDAVVLSTGGILGLGSREYEVPWDRIAMSPDGQDIMVGIAKDDVETEFSAFEVQPAPASEPEITEEPESGSDLSE
jgi:sporulation protein YlmC with PRC-barrel domain